MKSKPILGLWVLSLFAILLVPISTLAQQEITVITASINQTLEPGESVPIDISIANDGDAPLTWSAELTDIYGRGPGVDFTKADFANWIIPANQDRISNNIWITRGDNQSIFNAKSETSSDNSSPAGTEWALGLYNDATVFDTFKNMHGNDPLSLVGNTATLHTISDGDYYEVDFTSWTGSNGGGGFAYTRHQMFQYLSFNSANAGSILATSNTNLSIQISAEDLEPGTYTATLTILSDDADEGIIEIPITLEVSGYSEFEISETSFSQTMTTGDEPVVQTFSITNNGVSALEWDSDETSYRPREMSGVTISEYSDVVDPGETVDYDITFSASESYEGSYEWPFTIYTNDPDNDEVVLSIALEIIGVPTLYIDEYDPEFDATFVDATSSKTIYVTNDGTGELQVTGITSDASQFTPTKNNLTIEPGDTEEVDILFSPDGVGEFSADITFTSNDPDNPSLSTGVSGEGVEAPTISVSPLEITDDITTADNVSHTITIGNSGPGNLDWSVDINGEAEDWLSVDASISEGESNITGPESSTTFDLIIDGPEMIEGDYEATATIYSNDPFEPDHVITINVSVTGTPDISGTLPASISAVVGATDVFDISIDNSGDGFLNVSNVTSDNAVLVPGETSFIIPPSSSYSLPVSFAPLAEQTYDIDLTITSDDPDNSSFVVDITADGLPVPGISISATEFNVVLAAGTSTTEAFTITNTGNGLLSWDVGEVYFSKDNYADYTQAENQDRIKEDVWLTRRDYEPLFNYFEMESYSPNGEAVMFAEGETSSLVFDDYSLDIREANDYCGSCMEDNTYSIYLVDHDEYYDLAFDFWQSDGSGGGFSYLRRPASPWLTLDNYGESIDEAPSSITATFDATNLNAGEYEFSYDIKSNDPANPSTTITFMLEVTGDPNAAIDEGSDFGFGDQIVDTEGTGLLIITNTGSATLEVSDIQFDDAAFSAATTTASVEPGESVDIDLTFVPSLEQSYSATGSIISNDVESPTTFSVAGNGVEVPDLGIDVNSFEVELLSGGLAEMSFTITNNNESSASWSLEQVKVAGAEEIVFEKTNFADWTLAENQDRVSENLWITRADDEGLFNAALETDYTNGYRGERIFELEIPPIVVGYDASPHGTLWLEGPAYEGGNYDTWRSAHDGSAAELPGNTLSMWDLEDDRHYDIEFLSWQAGECCGNPPNGGGFSYRRYETVTWLTDFSSTGSELDATADEEVTFNVDAEGIGAGDYNAVIVISDGLNTIDITVDLSVLGLPEISVEEDGLDFGTVSVGNDLTKEIEISNVGLADLEISSITSDDGAFTIANVPSSIGIDETAVIEVTFAPTSAANYSATLSINSNAENGTASIDLTGVGQNPPILGVDKTFLEESLFSGSSASQTFTISNTGDADLEWNLNIQGETVEFAKADWADFTQAENQDRITDNVWITRADSKGIFNIAQEEEYTNSNNSPVGTLWAYGPTGESREIECCVEVFLPVAQIVEIGEGEGSYSDWRDVVGGNPSPNNTYSMYLEDDDLFFDVVFTSWTSGNENGVPPGGGFSYTRTPVFYEYQSISFSQTEGVVAPGEDQVVTVFFNPTGSFEGRVELPFKIESNDPSGEAELTISLNVSGIIVDDPIDDQLINEGFSSTNIDISGLFLDAQDDPLSYNIESSDGSVASAVESAETLTVSEVGTGTTTISITAEDGNGNSDFYEFDFRVNAVPEVTTGIADQSYENSFGSDAIDISSVFADADGGDVLEYSVSTSADGVVDVAISNGMLTLTEVGPGTVNVTVTANDGFGGGAEDVFEVFVNKINQTITFGALGTVGDDVGSIQLNATASSGLTVTYQSSNTSVATVSGSTLTILSDGQTTITASQAGDDDYNAATPVDQQLTVEEVLSASDLVSIEIYPNPVDDYLSISSTTASKLEIYHLDGKLVLSQEVAERVDLTKLEQGVYLIKLMDKNESEIYSGRLVKN